MQAITGTGLAGYVEELFSESTRDSLREMEKTELLRFEAEGAAMSLDAMVAYALETPAGKTG